jgi:hypothetical protein
MQQPARTFVHASDAARPDRALFRIRQPRALTHVLQDAEELFSPMNATNRDLLRLVGGTGLFVGVSAVVLKLGQPRPFLSIWVVAVLLCVWVAVHGVTEWARRLSLVGFGLALSFGLLEAVFTTLDVLKPGAFVVTGTATERGYIMEEGELGYAPTPGKQVRARKTAGKELVYDGVYTISDLGVRVTKGDPNGDTWLFMGCSMTFGEGVNDDQTLPAYFSAELGYRANVVNLGFHGYGPHQMLRSLETDRLRPLVHAPVKQVIYQSIWDHPQRAAGRVSWDLYGPSYTLTREGVAYAGPFRGHLSGFVLKVLYKSDFFRFVLDHTLYRPDLSEHDIELYARILERSAQLARDKFGTGFTVLYWDEDTELSRRVLARLQRTALPILLVSTVIPRGEWVGLEFPGDGHPKPAAYRRLAVALAERFRDGPLVARSPGGSSSATRSADAHSPRP